MNELYVEAKLENVDEVLAFIAGECAACPPKTLKQINIAVDEIFSNIARYAYNPEIGGASVRIAVGDEVTVEFEDSGRAYNPLAKDDPDVDLPSHERGVGGLGVFMVKNIMDSVEYRHEGNKNIMTIKKGLG